MKGIISSLTNVKDLLTGFPATWTKFGSCVDEKGNPEVALTFDDAPCDPAMMAKLLDILKRRGANATFFVISSFVKKSDAHKEIMKRAVREGHEVANHGCYDKPMNQMTESQFKQQLLECEEVLLDLNPDFGKYGHPKLFRAPCGIQSSVMTKVLKDHGYQSILGLCYSFDANIHNQPQFHFKTLKSLLFSGSIVIQHCPCRKREQTLEVTTKLLELKYSFKCCRHFFNRHTP